MVGCLFMQSGLGRSLGECFWPTYLRIFLFVVVVVVVDDDVVVVNAILILIFIPILKVLYY